MCLLTNFYNFFFNKHFSRYLFKFTADLKGTTRDVFISRFCTKKSLAPVIFVEDFSSKILCLQMKI